VADCGAGQQAGMRRIGVLMAFAESNLQAQSWVAAFTEGLQKLGWVEGRNLRIELRWATPDVERTQQFAKELVALVPDLLIASSTPTTRALMQQTRTIPIVFTNLVDPVGSGLIASLSRPGGGLGEGVGAQSERHSRLRLNAASESSR
jgi:putative ABC transport system substrate-binding protein